MYFYSDRRRKVMVSLSLVQSMDQKNGSNPRELEQLLARIAA